jgi:integrase
MGQSNGSKSRRKAANKLRPPRKPFKNFPLSPHASGKWCKRIHGRLVYFGSWYRTSNGQRIPVEDGWRSALQLFESQKTDLFAGRVPRVSTVDVDDGALTLKQLGDRFLTAKGRKVASGEMTQRQLQEYQLIAQLLADKFGKFRRVDDIIASDFESLRADMAKRWKLVRLSNAITRVKSIFKFGIENGLITKTICYGSEFKKPSKADLRREKAERGTKLLEPEQIRQLIDKADVTMKAMVMLGINSALGNADVAGLSFKHINLETGWLDYARKKTGIGRRCKLWGQTVEALKAAIKARPRPRSKEGENLIFINDRGLPFVRMTPKSRTDLISVQFADLLKSLGLHREKLSFYCLRHCHRTASDNARDTPAADLVMGHCIDGSVTGYYREKIDDSRIEAVVAVVYQWLYGEKPTPRQPEPETPTAETQTPPPPPTKKHSNGVASNATKPSLRLFVG